MLSQRLMGKFDINATMADLPSADLLLALGLQYGER